MSEITNNHNYDIMDEDSMSFCGHSAPEWTIHLRPGYTVGADTVEAIKQIDSPDGENRKMAVIPKEPFVWWTVQTMVGCTPSVDIRTLTPRVLSLSADHYMDRPFGENAGCGFESEEAARAFAAKHGRPCVLRAWDGWAQKSAEWLN